MFASALAFTTSRLFRVVDNRFLSLHHLLPYLGFMHFIFRQLLIIVVYFLFLGVVICFALDYRNICGLCTCVMLEKNHRANNRPKNLFFFFGHRIFSLPAYRLLDDIPTANIVLFYFDEEGETKSAQEKSLFRVKCCCFLWQNLYLASIFTTPTHLGIPTGFFYMFS